ncbi:hypothetical protein DPMN_096896 [Dreissena polymorpha]|uniref:Uncharacterized protein n=1 Tax=Dreissena polymorpha TaxID=45954 RepID=A0A9D4R568_DREPO|nr:hypothetical protein DPMN_096896 [Dreissena polymorpha]
MHSDIRAHTEREIHSDIRAHTESGVFVYLEIHSDIRAHTESGVFPLGHPCSYREWCILNLYKQSS